MKIQSKICPFCKKPAEYYDITAEEYSKYKEGAHIQVAFPCLLAKQRERLLTGICGTCWDDMFSDPDGKDPSE